LVGPKPTARGGDFRDRLPIEVRCAGLPEIDEGEAAEEMLAKGRPFEKVGSTK
jgi:hypothetical protein